MNKKRTWIMAAAAPLGVLVIVVWRVYVYEESKWCAILIEHWCDQLQEDCTEVKPDPTGGIKTADDAAGFLAIRLAFLMDLYEADIRFVSPSIEPTVSLDYQHTLTITVNQMRKLGTNDLGSDPKVWVAKYTSQ